MPAPKQSLASRAARDPALLKRVVSNPNLRYKLPSSMLTVAQRRARTNAQAYKTRKATDAALNDPTTPLAGVNLGELAKRITDGQYAPVIGELDRATAETTGREAQSLKRTGGIYDTINRYQGAAMAAQNAQQAQGATAVAGLATSASGQVDAAAAQQRAQAARDAQIRGVGLEGGSMEALAARTVAAKDSIAQRGQIAGNSIAANAQTNNAVLGGIGMATQQRGGEQQSNIQTAATNKLAELAGKRSDVATAKGGDLTKTLLGLRQQSTDEFYTSAGLGLKSKLAADDAAADVAASKTKRSQKVSDDKTKRAQDLKDDATKRKMDERKWGRTLNKYGVSNAAWYQWGKSPDGIKKREAAMAKSKAKGKGKGSSGDDNFLGPKDQGNAKNEISATLNLVKQFKAAGTTQPLIRAALLAGEPADKQAGRAARKPIDAIWLNVAMDIAFRGGISQANIKALHAAGIKVKPLGYKTLGKEGAPKTLAGDVSSDINNALFPGTAS